MKTNANEVLPPLLPDPEFDGIRQGSNEFPFWYKASFIGMMAVGFIYLVYYLVLSGWSSKNEYREEVLEYNRQYGTFLSEYGPLIPEGNPLRGNIQAISAGRDIFNAKCASCHKADATGLIGPNLTDDIWLHGNTESTLFELIMNGVDLPSTRQRPSRGAMPAHRAILAPQKVWSVLAWLTTKNKNIRPD